MRMASEINASGEPLPILFGANPPTKARVAVLISGTMRGYEEAADMLRSLILEPNEGHGALPPAGAASAPSVIHNATLPTRGRRLPLDV